MKRLEKILILIAYTAIMLCVLSGCSSYESGGYLFGSGGEFGDSDGAPEAHGAYTWGGD